MRNSSSLPPSPKKRVAGKHGQWPVAYAAAQAEAAADDGSLTIADYAQTLWRHRWVLASIVAAAVLAAAWIADRQPRVYQAEASIEIQPVNEDFLNLKDIDPTAAAASASGDAYVQTQADILQQDSLIEQVVKRLKLAERPDYQPHPGIIDRFRAWIGLPSKSPAPPLTFAVQVAKSNLNVITPREGRVVKVDYDSTDPQLAAEFANTLVQVFSEQGVESRWQAADQVKQWLQPQLTQLKAKLDHDQAALAAYARSAGLVITEGQANAAAQKLALLEGSLAQAQADRIAKEPVYDLSKRGETQGVGDDPTARDYQVKLTDLRRQLADLEFTLTPANPKVQKVQAQIDQLESALKNENSSARQRVSNEYEAAVQREQLLNRAYQAQSTQAAGVSRKIDRYNALKHQVDTSRQLYDTMLQKVSEAGIASAIRPSTIRVVGPAQPPLRPYKPNLPLDLGIGLFIGLVGGIGCITFLEQSNRRICAPGDAVFSPMFAELGAIPAARRLNPVSARLLRASGKEGLTERITWEQKDSELSESFRAVLASILLPARNGETPRVMVLTSPQAGEGKTTVASNLAIALAEIKHRVLLVDGDMRRPRLHEIFDVANTSGLSDLLCENESVLNLPTEQLVRKTAIPNLFLCPSGPGPDGVSDRLYSPRMLRLFCRFREEFDHILIDTPPSLEFADARVLARNADGVILVFRANRTGRRAATAVVDQLIRDRIPILGTVLNDWDPRTTGGYADYAYRRNYGYRGGRQALAAFGGPHNS